MTVADLVVRDATVHTLDPARPVAGALAVREGLIVAVGDALDVRPHIGPRTEVVDGRGLAVTPGLVDSHQHPLMGVAAGRGVDAAGVTTTAGLLDLLRRAGKRLPPDAWMIVTGVEYGAVPPHALHRRLIDDAVAGRPAFLWFADAHNALMSGEGLRRAGITGPIDFGDRAEIVVDDHGVPTGHLHELSAVLHGYGAVPPPGTADLARDLARLLRAQAAAGITGVHVPDLWPGTPRVLGALDSEDRLPVRVLLAPWALPGGLDDTLDTVRDLREERGRRWRVGAVKFFLDGTVDGGSAWLHRPDCCGEGTHPVWDDPERYDAAVRRVVELGLPCFTHAIGDRAVTHALDAYRRAGTPDRGRHRIEHAEILAEADITRFAALDVVASMQPTHLDWTLPDHTDNWSRRLGPGRCRDGFRCADIVRAGGRVALGSDWPLATYDPRVVMAGAVLRRPAGRRHRAPVGAEQALTPAQALAGYTAWAAYGAGEERFAGRVREGYRADLTVFGGDPLATPPDDLPDVPVLLTVVDGRVVHRN
ncbi:amidohydrolase [Actinomadura spongiicola]|uniref:Amidohydrolase n=1 Tax=Actinomadura spongiicola TaxID=2303421 RepID=A0A372GQE5_9ACTN|nr:amidohydrolase [Actinomadura spongiicola]RFS87319.1 amidohydrolase [Actinomadura spongiicola]